MSLIFISNNFGNVFTLKRLKAALTVEFRDNMFIFPFYLDILHVLHK